MPTAVITESSENTMSITAICADDAPEHRWPPALSGRRVGWRRAVFLRRLDLDEDLVRGLVEQEQAAEQQHQVAPADALAEHA